MSIEKKDVIDNCFYWVRENSRPLEVMAAQGPIGNRLRWWRIASDIFYFDSDNIVVIAKIEPPAETT